jgi:cob(I)alamin adenosyltransferase
MQDEIEAPVPVNEAAVEVHPGGRGRPDPTWVEELAGPDDYWLTLTDAARVTRRQEVTIRRWVATGTLPVRNRPLGLNKRTRHVRASDLAKLSPIVDASATISGATAQIDLLSIPTQQAEILARHQQVQQQLESIAAQAETASRERHQIEERVGQTQSEVTRRFQQMEERESAVGRQVTSLKQAVQRLSGSIKELQDEQKAVRQLQEHDALQIRAFDEAQSQHLARIQRVEKRAERIEILEKRQAEEAKQWAEQQRRLELVATQQNALVSAVGKVEETLARNTSERRRAEESAVGRINQLQQSLTQLGDELHQQTALTSQQVHALQRQMQESESQSQPVRDLLTRQGQQIEQLTQQVRALAEAKQEREVESKVPRRKRARVSK